MQVPLKEKLGMGIGEFGNNLFWQFFMYFLLYFYTDIYVIAPGAQAAATAGKMFLVVRTWDAVFDVIVGLVADRTHTPWGKFRPYLLYGAVPFGLAGVLAFYTPDFSATGKILYAYITYTFLMMMYSVVSIPQNSILGVMTPDSLERTVLSKYKFVFAFAAGLVAQFCTPLLVVALGHGNERVGYQMTMILYAVVAVTFFIVAFAAIRERVVPAPSAKSSLREDARDLLTNVPWLVLSAATLFWVLSIAVRSGTLIYYFKYVLQTPNHEKYFSAFLVIGTMGTIIGTLLIPYFSRLLGKRNLFIVSMLIANLLTWAYCYIPPSQLALLFVLQALIGLTQGSTCSLLWAMYADCADFSDWRNNRRATALVFSAAIMAQKFGWSIGGYVNGQLMEYYGYVGNAALSTRTEQGILSLISVYPAVLGLTSAAILLGYTLREATIKQISADLALRRSAAS